jgi:hypothetical protein
MNSKRSFHNFLKEQIADLNSVSTGSLLLDRVYKIPLHSFSLIRTEPYAGGTAVLLQLVQELTNAEHTVVYADVGDSLLAHRLHGVNLENLKVIKPTEGLEILEVVHSLVLRDYSAVYILDNFSFIQDNYSLKTDISSLALQIKQLDPKATIIASQRKGVVNSIWSSVLDLSHVKNIYDNSGENQMIGHMAKATTSKGSVEFYIEHTSGRVSKGYELATLEVEKGTQKSGIFDLDGVRAKGFYRFIEEYDNGIRSN